MTQHSRIVGARGGGSGKRQQAGVLTRHRLLDAAEQLFSERGFDGVSMRDIALASGVTLALANYHFGTKDGLFRAVIERRVPEVSLRRRAALAKVSPQATGNDAIRAVLDALARPWVEMRRQPGGMAYTRLIAREAGDPLEASRGIVETHLDPIAREFIAAMVRALPGVPRRRVEWSYHFFIGALLLIMANPDRVQRLSGSACRIDSDTAVVRAIVEFFGDALAGAPVSPSRGKKVPINTTRSRR